MSSERRGSALIVTLVLVLLLTAATAAAARGARSSGLIASNQRAQAVSRAMAESGVLAARHRLEDALRVAQDSQARMQIFDALETESPSPSSNSPLPFVSDTLGDGVFAAAVVNVSARLDVNAAGSEGLSRLFRTVAAPADADRVASRIAARVSGDLASTSQRARAEQMQTRDSLLEALLGRPQGRAGMMPFESLDELDEFVGTDAPWLASLAPLLTVDGDGVVDRRHAPKEVRAAASGSLVDAPTRVLLVARGWMSGHALTREIQAVYAIEGNELHLVRWRERDR